MLTVRRRIPPWHKARECGMISAPPACATWCWCARITFRPGASHGEHPSWHVVLDGQVAARLRPLLSAERYDAGRAAALLRVAIPHRRNRQQLLRHSYRIECAALGRADTARFRVQHQGVSPLYTAPNAGGEPREGDSRRTRSSRQEERLRRRRAGG